MCTAVAIPCWHIILQKRSSSYWTSNHLWSPCISSMLYWPITITWPANFNRLGLTIEISHIVTWIGEYTNAEQNHQANPNQKEENRRNQSDDCTDPSGFQIAP